MKILLIGNGAREHIIAEKLAISEKCESLIVFGKAINPGIEAISDVYHVGDLNDNEAIVKFAAENKPDFAVVGPENPIANGVVDALKNSGIPSASPTKKMGQLESSKAFTRELVLKYNIPGNPRFQRFSNTEGMMDFAKELEQIVVKADGLHGGKGVLVMGDHFKTLEEGIEAAQKFIESDGYVVIEEKLIGQEFSLMSFVDGKNVVDMPAIQDHKRAFEGDLGPNTGGMGTYSYPKILPFLNEQHLIDANQITQEVAIALEKELGEPFTGIMYGGFMATKNGVKLIEYNARFGDPEAMNALSLLETDLVDIFVAQIEGKLDEINIKFSEKATVCKYVVPEGYPTNSVKNVEIKLGDVPSGVDYYFASIDKKDDKLFMLGSRAIAFIAQAKTIEEAEKLAQKAVENVEGPVFFRRDIGTKELIEKRVKMMKEIGAIN